MNRLKYALKFACMQWPLKLADAANNRRHCRAQSPILITRHAAKRAYTFRDFLAWVTREVPELRSKLEFRRLPFRAKAVGRYSLHVSWAGDTIDLWSPRGFQQALRLTEDCRRLGIPVLNPIDRIGNTGKSRGAQLMRAAGVRTPACVPIDDPDRFRDELGGLSFPLLIRDERGHGRPAALLHSRADLERVNFSDYHQPIAAEFIDTSDARDGLFRKYRYVAAGELGMARHMIVNEHWEVRPERRLDRENLRDEELAYIGRPDPHHATLQRARRALGLDLVGFDYSLDRQGGVVVWEANPFLNLNYPKNLFSRHIFTAVERNFAAVAWLYLSQAGAEIPCKIHDLLGGVATYPNGEPRAQAQLQAA